VADERNHKNQNPPFTPPVMPMTVAELLTYHVQNSTLQEFLAQYDCGRGR
jgi:hypothetical protein